MTDRKYEYKIIRYKYVEQDDPVVPVDLLRDREVNITEEEFKHILEGKAQYSIIEEGNESCQLCKTVGPKLKRLL